MDTSKLSGIEQVVDDGINAGEYEKAIVIAKQGVILAQKIDRQKSKGFFLHKIGVAYYNLTEYQQAINFYQQALSVREQIGDSLGMAKTLGNIGNTYNDMSDYSKALDMDLRCLKICEKIHINDVLKNVLDAIGAVYKNTGEYEKSLDFNMRSLRLAKKMNDNAGIAVSFANLGQVYALNNQTDVALSYFEKALPIAKDVGDNYTASNTLLDIGGIYQKKNDFIKALTYFKEGKKGFEELQDKASCLVADLSIGSVYINLNRLKEAEEINILAIKTSKELGLLEFEAEAYQHLREIYDKMHKPFLAYEVFKKYIILKDSLYNAASQKELVKHEMSFEFDKKETQMKLEEEKRAALAASESKRQRVVIYGVSFGFLLVLILVAVVYRNLRENKKKNKIIETQKAEVEHKQKEILDSILYAQRIQKALLASETLLNENLPEHFVLFKPKDIVSGDFYWATAAHNRFYLVTADSTGHGVPGAFMTLIAWGLLDRMLRSADSDNPSKVLTGLHRGVQSLLGQNEAQGETDDGLEAGICFINMKKRKMT
ncbi:MAG: tetratricopeptide repeat protein, partial [Bacteroidia bacterium]